MKKLCPLFLLLTLIVSCSKEEEKYPFERSPYVDFNNITFHDSMTSDSLILTFTVWDREGDIGSGYSEVNEFELILDEFGRPVSISGDRQPHCYFPIPASELEEIDINYRADGCRIDFIIPEIPPFSCDQYRIIKGDTLFIRRIKNYYDLLIDFKDAEDESYNFLEIFNTDDCNTGNFNARLIDFADVTAFQPFLGNPLRIEKLSDFSYSVSYVMQSALWELIFAENQFELEFQVVDQASNVSNITTSGLVTLEEITEQ